MPRLFLFHLSFETLQHCLQIKKLEIKAFSCSTKDPIIKHTKLHQKGFGLTCPQPESSRIPTVPSFCHNTSTVLRNGPIFYTNLSPKHLFFFPDFGQDTFKFCFVAKKLALQQVHPSVYNLNPLLWWVQIPLWGAVVTAGNVWLHLYRVCCMLIIRLSCL